ncbi:MAG: hypothetical protein HZA17_06190 [Nitrospirae bacterium]|nr:hypothetical protein [Nitrospirota bacterium]
MKAAFFVATALLPLLAVSVLAVFGMTMNMWVYIILAVICPVVAGILWFMNKDAEKKVGGAGKVIGKK